MRYIQKFINQNEPVWDEYALLLTKVNSSPNILKQLRDLYPVIASHYSYLNRYSKSSNTIVIDLRSRLESYLFQSRLLLNVSPPVPYNLFFKKIWFYFSHFFPTTFYKNKGIVLLTLCFFILSALFSFFVTLYFPGNVTTFLSIDEYLYYANTIDMGLKYQNFFIDQQDGIFLFFEYFMSYLVTSLYLLIAGVFLGIGCFFVMAKKTFAFGAITALYYKSSHYNDYILQILQHGIFEFFGFLLASVAGLMIGSSYFFSGHFKVQDLIKKKTKEALILLGLSVILFFLAAYTQAFVSTQNYPFHIKTLFISISCISILSYILYSYQKRN